MTKPIRGATSWEYKTLFNGCVTSVNKLLGQWLALQKGNTLPRSVEIDSSHHFLDRLIAASSVINESAPKRV